LADFRFRFSEVMTPRGDMSTVSLLSDRRRGSRALFALMARQHGVASCVQARNVGVSRAVEERLVDEGALIRPMRGIVAAGGVPLTFSAQAMAAALRPGVTALSHGSAARLHCLAGFEHHATIEVIGARGSHIRVDPPVHARYSRGRISDDIVMLGAIPVTSIPLTLTHVAPQINRPQLVAAVGAALDRGESADEIRIVAERWREPGRPGPAQLLDVLDAVIGGAAGRRDRYGRWTVSLAR
jgi:hypothetical protein